MARYEKTALMRGEGGIVNRFRSDRWCPCCHGFAVLSTFIAVGGDF